MSRHRNLRGAYAQEEYDDGYDDDHYDDHGYDDGCLSPTEAQFVYRRERTESGSEVGPSIGLVSGLEAYHPSQPQVPEETTEELVDDAFAGLSVQAPKPISKSPNRTEIRTGPKFELGEPPAKPNSSTAASALPNPKVVLVKAEAGVGGVGGGMSDWDGADRRSRSNLLESGEGRKGTPSSSPARPSTPSQKPPRYMGRNSMPLTPRAPRVFKKPEGGKDELNLVVIGHVDAGKSTLMGHLLLLLGHVNQRTMHKYKTEATKAGKGSFAFAWVLDESKEERDRGVTMDIARSSFETKTKKVTLLDAPGHRDFIPNMITGATQADAAVLVVNAAKGEFEAGFQSGGQTREHAMLARSLGVAELIVAVNKMDSVGWQKERYDEVVDTMKAFLKTAGFSKPKFLPLAGLAGDNLVAPVPSDHPLAAWYKGPCLLQLIDELPLGERDTDKDTRVTVSDVYKGTTGNLTLTAKVETGSVEVGDRLLAQPAGEWVVIRSLEGESLIDGVSWAGSEVSIGLAGGAYSDTSITTGTVLLSQDCPLVPGTRWKVNVLTFPESGLLLPGSPVVLHAHNLQENVRISRLISLLHKTSGEVLKKKPRSVGSGSRAVLELSSERALALEPFASCRQLGRFTLRSAGSTIAAGIVLKWLA